jgi:hypothetical protein
MELDLERVRENVQKASTEDLLDRATVYRSAVEPTALPVILEELRSRGVTPEDVVAYEQARPPVVRDPDGTARSCSRCRKPAVTQGWGWQRLFGKLPVFPRKFYFCEEHRTVKEPVLPE